MITCFGPCKVLFLGRGSYVGGIGMCACISYGCVYRCMCVGTHENVWAYVWKPKADIRSPSRSMFSTEAVSLSELADTLNFGSQLPLRILCLHHLSTRIMGCQAHLTFGGRFWESQLLSSHLHGKALVSKPAPIMQWLRLAVNLIGYRKTYIDY